MNQTPSLEAPPAPRRIGRWITVIVIVGLAAVLARRGFSFYRLRLSERGAHPDYRTLSPSGLIGHGYGIVGTALILTNLLYLVRRRFAKRIPAWMGSVKAWLNAHVFTGLVGSVLVLFHSAFQLRTPIATVTSVSLAIVVVTGLVGLYLYALVPREGLKPLEDRLEEIEPLLPGLAQQVAHLREGDAAHAAARGRVVHPDRPHGAAVGVPSGQAAPRNSQGRAARQDGPRPRAQRPEARARVLRRAR